MHRELLGKSGEGGGQLSRIRIAAPCVGAADPEKVLLFSLCTRKLGGTIDVIGGQAGTIRRVEGRRRDKHATEENPIQVRPALGANVVNEGLASLLVCSVPRIKASHFCS